LNTER